MRISKRFFLWVVIIGILLLVAMISLSFPVAAQPAQDNQTPFPRTYTALPSPTNNGGNAQWTIKSMTFQSNYPKGADFTLDATSSAGKITNAEVVWRHSPNSRNRRQGKFDPTTGQFTAGWTSADNQVPQWVSVEYWWNLTDEAGNAYETNHKFDEYADNTRKWKRLESDDVLIIWQEGVPDEVGQLTLDAMKEGRTLYTKWWGKLLNYKPRAIIYADFTAFNEWNPRIGTAVNGIVVAGTTSQDWGGTVQVYLPSYGPQLTPSIVRHEIGHLYQFYSGASSPLDWFIEGDAEYQMLPNEIAHDVQAARDIAARGNMPSLQDTGPSIRGGSLDGYEIGCAFFVWLEQTYGPDAHLKLWQLLGSGKTRRVALQTLTGKDFTSIEIDFRTWLGAPDPIPPTILPTLTFLFMPSPTYEPTRVRSTHVPTAATTVAATVAATAAN